MTISFITVAILICQVGVSNKLICYDKGSDNLRSNEVKSSVAFIYYKCKDRDLKVCDMDNEWDGCKFTSTDKTVTHSSYTCP